MKTLFPALLFTALLLTAATARAAKEPDDRPKLAIVVVENTGRQGGAITDFIRLDLAFQHVAKQRKWPVAVVAERFASNTPARETELRVFSQPVRQELAGELMFRSWMILTVNGVKHDFGMVTFRYHQRALENMDDVLEKVFRGGANAAADKIEPLLWPKPDTPKP